MPGQNSIAIEQYLSFYKSFITRERIGSFRLVHEYMSSPVVELVVNITVNQQSDSPDIDREQTMELYTKLLSYYVWGSWKLNQEPKPRMRAPIPRCGNPGLQSIGLRIFWGLSHCTDVTVVQI